MNSSLAVALAFLVGLVVERALLRWRWTPYFRAGLVLSPPPLPIAVAPEGSGQTRMVHWEVVNPGLVRFWAPPGGREAPMGLHGVVHLVPSPQGLDLDIRWSPPWSPVLACAWLAGLGITRGEGLIMVSVALVIVAVMAVVYRRFAFGAAAQMRWIWVSSLDPED